MRDYTINNPDEIERRRLIAAARTMHGHSQAPKGSPEYRTFVAWCAMRQRCGDPGRKDYARYGGRGITVCVEWNEYVQFFADMGLAPVNKSLDRIDNSQGYSFLNCKWSTKQEQARNRRTSKRLLINGQEKTLAEWAVISGVPSSTIRMRITRGDAIDGELLRSSRKVG